MVVKMDTLELKNHGGLLVPTALYLKSHGGLHFVDHDHAYFLPYFFLSFCDWNNFL